jgi:hypothetical protein
MTLMSYNYLEDYALKNIWCAPRQDRQSIVQPARITPKGGVWNYVTVGWRTHVLPQSGTRFHVYQVGQLHPLLLGLLPQQYKWVNFADACNKMTLIVDLYLDSGVQLPRFEAWYMIDADKNLFMAVRDPRPNIDVRIDEQPLYIRVYTNAYYQTLRNDPRLDYIQVAGNRITSTDQILALQSQFQTLQSQPGQVYAFVNGFKVSGIDLFTVKVGDVVEYVYDASIYKVVDFNISDLRTFDSLRDLKTKYLLHYAGVTDQIDYQDDIDLFLVQPATNNRFKGVYVHRNEGDTLRMVTHKDYSVVVPVLAALARYQPDWTDLNAMQIRMHIRYGGWNRPLVFEANRIKELYKLQDNDIRAAMLGIDSTVNNWRADVLENAAYPLVMEAEIPCVPEDTVEEALGYNAISKILGDTPQFPRVMGNAKVVDVPYGLQNKSTVYEYDDNGLLLGYYPHTNGSIHVVDDTRSKLVEILSGVGDTLLDEVYGQKTQTLDSTIEYRMYTCPYVNGVPSNVWTDVTGSPKYAVLNGTLTWLTDPTTTYTLVRGNSKFLAYSLDILQSRGVLEFSLVSQQRRGSDVSFWTMQQPMGELTIFLNGRTLIKDIDYYLAFPRVVIINKEYLVNPLTATQHIDVRFTGFSKADGSLEDTEDDKGFIVNQLLSHNNKYDLRDDKVLRIIAGGALYDRSELKFSETDGGVAVLDPINGKPYLVQDIVVPTRGQTIQDTYTLRAKALVIDKAVSDYMTQKLPEPPFPNPPVIEALYEVYSPFCSRLIYDLVSGALDDPRMYQQYGTALVLELCKPYEYLLKTDPTQDGLVPDPKFVIVHPHNLMTVIDIGIYQYKFLDMAVKQYLGGKVTLNDFLRIKDYMTES